MLARSDSSAGVSTETRNSYIHNLEQKFNDIRFIQYVI